MVRRDGSVKVVKLSSIYQQQMSDIQMSTWTMASAGASRTFHIKTWRRIRSWRCVMPSPGKQDWEGQ